jgi:hypothetical protein
MIVDTTVPTVSSVTSTTSNGSYNADDVIAITITFSEAVNGNRHAPAYFRDRFV